MKYFVGVAINESAYFYEQEFFSCLKKAIGDRKDVIVFICDYSLGREYYHRLQLIFDNVFGILSENCYITRMEQPDHILSMNYLKDVFLENCTSKCFINIFPSIIVPENMFEIIDSVYDQFDIMGGVHSKEKQDSLLFDPSVDELVPANYVCEEIFAIKRNSLELINFRTDFSKYKKDICHALCNDLRMGKKDSKIFECAKLKCKSIVRCEA